MTATDELRALLDERGVEWDGESYESSTFWNEKTNLAVASEGIDGKLWVSQSITPEQAIAATLGLKAKSHPYGYEPDTGAFDATRCECGCINDISATYCNDCGGEIEIDEHAEKEIYHTPAHMVFAEKHDDGSLEFGGKRYIAATMVSSTLTAEQVRETVAKHWQESKTRHDWQAIADALNATVGRGTCNDVWGDDSFAAFRCSECGAIHNVKAVSNKHVIRFCYNCGKRVEGGEAMSESYGQVPEREKYGNDGERESCGEVCGDDSFVLIGKAKAKLLEATNIEMCPDEMAVIDNILFRCWQMGWLDQLCDEGTRWHELFGTPERAARTVMRYLYDGCDGVECADGCPFYDVRYLTNCFLASNTSVHELRLWLEGDAE